MKNFTLVFVTLLVSLSAMTQTGQPGFYQGNQLGRETLADAPWKMKKTDGSGNLNPLPVFVYVRDADAYFGSIKLSGVSIRLKNAKDTAFGNVITFDTYSDIDFQALFITKSVDNVSGKMSGFDKSKPTKSPVFTVKFLSDSVISPALDYYTYLNRKHWYFTINLPSSVLTGYSDIIDIEVAFNIYGGSTNYSRMRVFRSDIGMPSLTGWTRGDMHYHTFYTTNTAEYGLPLDVTKIAATKIGMDWIAATDHSCDYDNGNSNMYTTWYMEGVDIKKLNTADPSFIFIRGMEFSLANSAGQIVHLLTYPPADDQLSLPYLGDAKGDETMTSVTLSNALDSIGKYRGFTYMAHPFAQEDKLPSLISGGAWNIADNGFPSNGSSYPGGGGSVVCNDLTKTSDMIKTGSTSIFFKDNILGAQLVNYRSTLTSGSINDPWNVLTKNTNGFVSEDTAAFAYYIPRIEQGMDAWKFLNQKALQEKALNPGIKNYKLYLGAGTDAHGSFNFSTTSYVMGVTGAMNDNVLGRFSVLTYTPNGMGSTGQNVLTALKQGHFTLSDGPIVIAGISTNSVDSTNEIIMGDDHSLNKDTFAAAKVNIQAISNQNNGSIYSLKIIVGTKIKEYEYVVNGATGLYSYKTTLPLTSLLQNAMKSDTLGKNEYFYIRTELLTYKDYGADSNLYMKKNEFFRSWSNPFWLQKYTGATVAIITTNAATSITKSSAILGGTITYNGGTAITERGVYYSKNPKPNISGAKATIGMGDGTFNATISGLPSNTTYYVVAYATNAIGTAFGNEISFTTQQSTGIYDELNDHHIRIYNSGNHVTINFPQNSDLNQTYTVRIYDLYGREIQKHSFVNNAFSYELNIIDGSSNGIYLVVVSDNSNVIIKKKICIN